VDDDDDEEEEEEESETFGEIATDSELKVGEAEEGIGRREGDAIRGRVAAQPTHLFPGLLCAATWVLSAEMWLKVSPQMLQSKGAPLACVLSCFCRWAFWRKRL